MSIDTLEEDGTFSGVYTSQVSMSGNQVTGVMFGAFGMCDSKGEAISVAFMVRWPGNSSVVTTWNGWMNPVDKSMETYWILTDISRVRQGNSWAANLQGKDTFVWSS